ncbi:hypothetical protein BHM03_00062712, partial [Ensete ventricosum]
PRRGFFSLRVTDQDHRGRATLDLQVLPFLLPPLPSPLIDTADNRWQRSKSIVTDRFWAVTERKEPQSIVQPSNERSAYRSTGELIRIAWYGQNASVLQTLLTDTFLVKLPIMNHFESFDHVLCRSNIKKSYK